MGAQREGRQALLWQKTAEVSSLLEINSLTMSISSAFGRDLTAGTEDTLYTLEQLTRSEMPLSLAVWNPAMAKCRNC